MIHNPQDLHIGKVVFLYPHTATASRACHAQLSVTVMKEPTAHWPRIMVSWREAGGDRWELVHRDNVRLKRASRPTEERREGDTAQDSGTTSAKWAKVKRLPGRVVANPEDQMELF